MQNTIVVKGRLVGSRDVRLDEPVSGVSGDVEVILRPIGRSLAGSGQSIADFLRGLPHGNRSREDIDRQVNDERNAWGECP